MAKPTWTNRLTWTAPQWRFDRLNSALAAYELLTTHNAERANELASHLDAQNLHRHELTEWTTERARQLATTEPDQIVLFAIDPTSTPE